MFIPYICHINAVYVGKYVVLSSINIAVLDDDDK